MEKKFSGIRVYFKQEKASKKTEQEGYIPQTKFVFEFVYKNSDKTPNKGDIISFIRSKKQTAKSIADDNKNVYIPNSEGTFLRALSETEFNKKGSVSATHYEKRTTAENLGPIPFKLLIEMAALTYNVKDYMRFANRCEYIAKENTSTKIV